MITCWSVKGGAGVSVVAAGLAGLLAARHGRSLLVDLGGDQPAVLGLSDPRGPGVLDWCDSGAPPEALGRLVVPVTADLDLLPRGAAGEPVAPERADELVTALDGLAPAVVVDAGGPLLCGADRADPMCASVRHDPAVGLASRLRSAGTSVFVTRPCYLSLRRAMRVGVVADGVVVVSEPGRSLDHHDVADLLGVPVLGVLEADPAVSRAVDAGTLLRRIPATLAQGLRRAG